MYYLFRKSVNHQMSWNELHNFNHLKNQNYAINEVFEPLADRLKLCMIIYEDCKTVTVGAPDLLQFLKI